MLTCRSFNQRPARRVDGETVQGPVGAVEGGWDERSQTRCVGAQELADVFVAE